MSISEDNKKLIQKAYDDSAESAFVMRLGKQIQKLGKPPAGKFTHHIFSNP